MRPTFCFPLVVLSVGVWALGARAVFAEVQQFTFVSSPQSIAVGAISEQITLQAQDASGTESKVPSTACVSLSSSSVGEFSSNATEWSPITVVTIAKNTANRNFYYKGAAEGVHTLTARVALKPETESRSCASWPVGEWPSGWSATQNMTVGSSSAAPPPENGAGAGSAAQNAAASSSSGSSSTGSSAAANMPSIYVNATVPQRGTAGAPVLFDAAAVGLKKEPLTNARYVWSFGDGGVAEGKSVPHVYHYPAAYVVMVTASGGEFSATDRKEISIVAPELVLSNVKEGDGGFIELKNAGTYDTDLSFWVLKSNARVFTIPAGTIIGAGKTIPFPAAITGLSPDPLSTALLYPNGNLVTAYASPRAESISAPVTTPAPATHPPAISETARAVKPASAPQPVRVPADDASETFVPLVSSTELLGAAGAATEKSKAPWLLGTALLSALAIGGYFLLRMTEREPTEAEQLRKEAAEYDIVE